ncbi:hypothetical protein DFH11DRAFT_1566414 [Phellopilus nigrolimitatus]|nr:hypothetical protein DFH11DRAFT_1566414 [Phellopilus nigrolimitatus]
MHWLNDIHPTLRRMPSPMELDAPASISNATLVPHDPGGSIVGFDHRIDITWQPDSHFNKLPHEIITEIFCRVCDVEHVANTTFESSTLTPLYLTHVSRLWRRIATSTPRLWTLLHVVVRRADINSSLELLKLWVPRCKSRPLKIDISFKEERGLFVIYPEDSLNFFRVITRTAALLRKGLYKELDKAYFETHVRAGSSGTLPILEERYLWYYGRESPPSPQDAFGVLLTVSGVRRSVSEFSLGYHEPLNTSLTKLELLDTHGASCLSTTELLLIFSEFPQLQRVSAYINHGDAPPQEMVVAANLKTLNLSWVFPVDCGAFFDLLLAPQLEHMEISGDLPAGGPWVHFWQFLRQSNPPLRSLAFQHFDATVSALGGCLAMCAQLESLWLENCVVDDDFIARLGLHSDNESVFARLHVFGLASAQDVSGDCLVQSLRNSNTETLKELFIFDCNGVLQEHCDAIEQYFEGTVHVETIITSPGDDSD